MDEETLRKNFEVWAATENYCLRFLEDIRKYDYSDTQSAWDGWLESARRADKRAREECAEIIRARKVAIECAIEFEQAYNHAIDDAIQEIRTTIPEE